MEQLISLLGYCYRLGNIWISILNWDATIAIIGLVLVSSTWMSEGHVSPPDEVNPRRPLLPEHLGRLADDDPGLLVVHPDGHQVLLPHLLHRLEVVVAVLEERLEQLLLVQGVQPGPHHVAAARHRQKLQKSNSRQHFHERDHPKGRHKTVICHH